MSPAAAAWPGDGPDVAVLEVFEEYVRTRDEVDPPPPESFLRRLDGDDSKRSFRQLLDAYAWTERALPGHVAGEQVLAGRFRLHERLGAGGMGQVWRATDERLGREVAVKIFTQFQAASLAARDGIRRESQLLASLDHPGIVTVLDIVLGDEHRFLVMDLVRGCSLEVLLERLREVERPTAADLLAALRVAPRPGRPALLADEPWPVAVAKVTAAVLGVLEASHGAGVVHRDLKPANVMLGAGGHPVLLDFGLGGRLGQAPGDLTGSLFGTARYVAPEQLEREAAGADVRTDLYQVGVVLYELLTRTACFGASAPHELFTAIRQGRFTLPRQQDRRIPEALEDICLRAMEVDPARRYQTAAAFREDIERFLAGAPVHAARYGRLGAAARAVRYRLRSRGGLVAAFAAVLLAGAVAWQVQAWRHVDLASIEVVAHGDGYTFEVEVDEPRFVLAAFRVREPGTDRLWIVPAALRGSDGRQRAPSEGMMLAAAGVHRLQAVPPEGRVGFDGSAELCVHVARSVARLVRVREAMAEMLAVMDQNDLPGVDLDLAEQLLARASRSTADAPAVPATRVFGGADWADDAGELMGAVLRFGEDRE